MARELTSAEPWEAQRAVNVEAVMVAKVTMMVANSLMMHSPCFGVTYRIESNASSFGHDLQPVPCASWVAPDDQLPVLPA
jgi:hypothetical protein